ncbi:MAG: patatin-like phospholipase family protein, partial [Myxococcota bacterium]
RVAWLSPSAHTAPPGALRHVRLDRAALLRPVGDRANQLWPTGTVRLRLDFEVVRKRAADTRPVAEATAAEAATLEGVRRWGRGLTERLVGLALGGGGSPGFAHVALIRALEQRADIPIDVVAGTSFGALVGAWYAGVRQRGTQEPARLQTLLDAGRRLNACLAVGMLDTGPLAHVVDRQFGGLRLSDVEMPFFPVSSEVDSGTVFVGRAGTLGRAVQMSGAFPPFFPPVIRGTYARLVDGGFVNNVPASVLRTEGASFVIASNSIGLIPPRESHPGLPRLRRVLAALNPVGRVEDAIRAGMMLFHRIGDSQALYADVSYEAAYTGFEFWDFNRGQAVIDQVQETADAFAERLAEAWRLRRRRS